MQKIRQMGNKKEIKKIMEIFKKEKPLYELVDNSEGIEKIALGSATFWGCVITKITRKLKGYKIRRTNGKRI